MLKDYDCTIEYHPSKANVVADALSCRAMIELRVMFACLIVFKDGSLLAELQVKPSWVNRIRTKQLSDESLVQHLRQLDLGESSDFSLNGDKVLCFKG